MQSVTLQAQAIFKEQNLSTFNTDNLSDADIVKIRSELQSNNITYDQAEQIALSKGMPSGEFAKLKSRLENKNVSNSVKGNSVESSEVLVSADEPVINYKEKDLSESLIFGSELFNSPKLNFEPNLKLATPMNYILGPGDELQINVFGVQEFSDAISVNIEGKVNIKYVGQLAVSGLTIEEASGKIKSAISKVYSTVQSGKSKVSIILSRIRTIKITLIGSKQPGNYSVSSLATVFNALFLGGGPDKNGSYRNIQLIRNNKVIRTIDLYRFLLQGNQSDNIGLKDNDVIQIPTYTQRVTLEGQVKRPGIFEMKNGENFTDLVRFASGFTDVAYTASISVMQKTSKDYKVIDIKEDEFISYVPHNGDVVTVSRILNRFQNPIAIQGAVFRPNTYAFYDGMRISDLVSKAEGLKEDAYTKRATIVRIKDDLTVETVSVNLDKALLRYENENIALKKEDVVTVYSILDLKENFTVFIDGEVKVPGKYIYHPNLTLNDLLLQAGGLIGSASKRVEVARMIQSDEINNLSTARSELINIEISPSNNEQEKNFVLKPFDLVTIRKMAIYDTPQTVTISGEVNYPGKYVLSDLKETVYSVIQRAGGITSLADLNGLRIRRSINLVSVGGNNEFNKLTEIPLDLKKIVNDPNGIHNIQLKPGDFIEIAKFDQNVKLVGGVLLNSEITYKKGKGLNYYINKVGGISERAWRKKIYIIYPNGNAAVTSSFLFFKSYPKITPGSQINIPLKPEAKKMSVGEWVSIGSVMTSLALLIVTAFK